MALLLTEEQAMLRDTARSFLAENAPVAQLRALRDGGDAEGYSPKVWQGFAELGFCGVLVAEEDGGLGLGHVEAGVVMEEIGRQLTASPFLATNVVAATALRAAGSRSRLAEIARGLCIATLAVDERSKHSPGHIALRAQRSGDGWRLDGAKTFVVDGHVADFFVVAARTSGTDDDAHGITLFAVPRDTAGVTVERTVMVDAHNAARIRFDAATVGADALLGTVDEGAAPLQRALDGGRAAAAAELLGIAEEVFARTVSYLKERRQFDRLIGEFQALQHRAATLYCDIELARAAVMQALQRLDADPASAADAVSIAKARAGRSATLAVQEGVQMHGGMGMTDEFDLGLYMKRVRVLQELFGDANFHADALARRRGY